MRNMFLAVLADIPICDITKALFIHLNRSEEIPTPRQLREIIHPAKPVWKPDWAAYVALKKKVYDGYYPLADERKFLKDCDEYAFNKRDDQQEEYDQALLQIEKHKQIGHLDD